MGSFLPLYAQTNYGSYVSIALLALGLTYLYSTRWDKINSPKDATLAWPKRLIRLGALFAFSGGAVIFVNSVLAEVLNTPPALYSTVISLGLAIYLPGMLSVAAGFVLGEARTAG